jgi:hypothetical protein
MTFHLIPIYDPAEARCMKITFISLFTYKSYAFGSITLTTLPTHDNVLTWQDADLTIPNLGDIKLNSNGMTTLWVIEKIITAHLKDIDGKTIPACLVNFS